MYELVLLRNVSKLKSFSFNYIYFNLTSSDWEFLKSTVFGRNSTLTLLINGKWNLFKSSNIYTLKNVSMFCYTPIVDIIFNRNHFSLYNIDSDIKKKLILDSIYLNNNEYDTFIANLSFSISKYKILSTFSSLLHSSYFSFISIMLNIFFKRNISYILKRYHNNIKLIYNLYRYL